MAYYRTCPNCGCNLDPGEQCDCEEVEEKKHEQRKQQIKALNSAVFLPKHTSQYELKLAAGFNNR